MCVCVCGALLAAFVIDSCLVSLVVETLCPQLHFVSETSFKDSIFLRYDSVVEDTRALSI